jgi:anti-sigma factor RsiW
MNCHEATPLVAAYSDGELDLVRSLDLEEHLSSCAACSQAYQHGQSVKKLMASADLYHMAPARLRREIRDRIGAKEHKSLATGFSWWGVFKPLIPALGVATVALLLIPGLRGPSATDRLGQEVVSNHVRSLMVDHRTDVASTDQHTVKPWFQGKLDFSPPVTDFAQQGFPLIGGRLDYVEGHPAAALVYRRREHVINLFVWPAHSNAAAVRQTNARQGFNLVHWTDQGMNFWAVSDLNAAELLEFSQLVK